MSRIRSDLIAEESSVNRGHNSNEGESSTAESLYAGDVTQAAAVPREVTSNAAQNVTEEPTTTPSTQQKQSPPSQPTAPAHPPPHTVGPPLTRGPSITTPSKEPKRTP